MGETQVTLVVTAHNMEEVILPCLQSLKDQTYTKFQGIIIENGSSDTTLSLIQKFTEQDKRFRVIHHANALGAGAARNLGIRQVTTPYFMLLDGDDMFHANMVEELVNAAQKDESDIVVCNMKELDHASGKTSRVDWALKTYLLANQNENGLYRFNSWQDMNANPFAVFMGWPWDKLYRTDFIRKHNLAFPEDMANSEDAVFVYEALVSAQHLSIVDKVLINHRMARGNTVSSSRTTNPMTFYDAICRIKDYLQSHNFYTEQLQKHFLNWAFDWTLWNVRTLANEPYSIVPSKAPLTPAQTDIMKALNSNRLSALELNEHEANYFSEYPTAMKDYANLMLRMPKQAQDSGPFGPLTNLPYGKEKPWAFLNPVEKAAFYTREKLFQIKMSL